MHFIPNDWCFFIALPKTQRDLEDHRPTQHERFLWSSAQVTSNTFKSYPSNFTPCISMYPDSQHRFHSPSCFIPLCFPLNLEPCLVTMHGSNYAPFSAPCLLHSRALPQFPQHVAEFNGADVSAIVLTNQPESTQSYWITCRHLDETRKCIDIFDVTNYCDLRRMCWDL